MTTTTLTEFQRETIEFHEGRIAHFRANLEHHRRVYDSYCREIESADLSLPERDHLAARMAKYETLIAEESIALAVYTADALDYHESVTK